MNVSDPFIDPCLDSEAGNPTSVIDGERITAFLGVFVVSVPLAIYSIICCVRKLHKSQCISQQTADALVEECHKVVTTLPKIINHSPSTFDHAQPVWAIKRDQH